MTDPVIALFEQEWSQLESLCSGLTEAQWAAATECPGWSVQDQLAHIIGTESSLAGLPRPEGFEPEDPIGYVHNEIGRLNEIWVASLRPSAGAEVLARFLVVRDLRLSQLRGFSPERFDEVGPTPVGQAPYREFMNVRVMDCWVHEQDIRRAVDLSGHLSGPIVEHSLGRFVPAMAMVVGKRAGATEGQSVAFELTGEAARRFAVVVVEGRAQVLAEVPEAPTATLRMDAETWWCLCLGRWTPGRVRRHGLVEVAGDAQLANATIDNLSFMI